MNFFVILCFVTFVNIKVAFSRRSHKKKWPPGHTHLHPTLMHQDDTSEECLSGNGASYRGFVSKTADGHRCLYWNKFTNPWGAKSGIGNHKYCRNPNKSWRPWCRVRRGRRVVRDFCDVPKCSTSVTPPVVVDTELTCGEKSERRLQKIVGGSFIAARSQPWVAAIFQRRSKFLCGGSLIAPCWLLTAAHCFPDGEGTNLQYLSVFLGKSAINETDSINEQKFTVEKLILHQGYDLLNDNHYNNDIALLKIKGSNGGGCATRSESVRTVCLPPPHTRLPAGSQCTIAGFGWESNGVQQYSQYLKEARVNLLSESHCQKNSEYTNLLTDNMLCAAGPDWSADACGGDSGGPLVCESSGRLFQFGIVSWGIGCAKKNNPGVYTQLTNYNKWIAENTQLPQYTNGVMYPLK
ncbi:urokinase-type plasminogen activator-like [Stigmatopora argus]